MCGVVGAVAERPVLPILLEGLKRLEYRGYDSAGVALWNGTKIQRVRAVGKVSDLVAALNVQKPAGQVGIAQTRWATHGKPSEANAHPHMVGEHLAIVHNGIIENHAELRQALQTQGAVFHSDTDTEVIAHLIAEALKTKHELLSAVQYAVKQLHGAYAVLVMSADFPDQLIAVRSGAPLVIGLGIGENFIGSDCLALLPVTHRFIYLAEGDIAVVRRQSVEIYDSAGHAVQRMVEELHDVSDAASKAGYKHYMLKEIYEQPEVIAKTITVALGTQASILPTVFGRRAAELLPKIEHIRIVACGTSYHAGLVARYWLEQWAGISCEVEVASELRYRHAVVRPNTLFLSVSQSGETADTLAALRQTKAQGYLASMTVCNVPTSSLVRESDLAFITQAGVEMGVASTKAFTTQLVGLLLFCAWLAQLRDRVEGCQQILAALQKLPHLLTQTLLLDGTIHRLAERFVDKHHTLFLGRGNQYPLALEGALKLKEISYIHAEGYAAGELKHGPLALVDTEMPVVAIVPDNGLLDKVKSNLHEVQTRGGDLLVITETALQNQFGLKAHFIGLPKIPDIIAPIVYAIPLQLLAYHVAVLKGTDVDQPRNLAKSVTVE